jgi:hypothetical protein
MQIRSPNSLVISTIADTGSKGHFFKQQDVPATLQTNTSTTESIDITLPNGSIITSEAQATMNLPTIPITAKLIHLFPELQSRSLLSIRQLWDAGCSAEFTQHDVLIKYKQDTILQGHRNPTTRLWQIPVNISEPQPHHQANQVNAITKNSRQPLLTRLSGTHIKINTSTSTSINGYCQRTFGSGPQESKNYETSCAR